MPDEEAVSAVPEVEGVVSSSGAVPLENPDDDWCLCLSGGGFRATLFHLGGIQRLNELGVLSRLSTITSVSGGSILNGMLASRWSKLKLGPDGIYENLGEVVGEPLIEFCKKDLRTSMLVGVRFNPLKWPALLRDRFSVSGNSLAEGYEPLFDTALSGVPQPGPLAPRFIFCSTNIRTGACWQFHSGPQTRMGDFYTGYCDAPHVRVSDAVAASSAFPPGFSAFRLAIPEGLEFSRIDPWGKARPMPSKRIERHAPDHEDILLTDGGVYDNLGVEPIWNSKQPMLVSDAGAPFHSVIENGQGVISRLKRAAEISMEQVAAVRKRWIFEKFEREERRGALWTLNTRLEDFPVKNPVAYSRSTCDRIHRFRTDLDAFTEGEIACLMNHGYALADGAVRSYRSDICRHIGSPFRWPNEEWIDDYKASRALLQSHYRKYFRDFVRHVTRHLPR